MHLFNTTRIRNGYTLIELLCVIAIIVVLASMVLGPASRVLQRVRADQWAEQSGTHLQATVDQLQRHFGGKRDFPTVSLQQIASEKLIAPAELSFLKDRRVTFLPFAGSDPDTNLVLIVQIKRGFWTETNLLTATKGDITRPLK